VLSGVLGFCHNAATLAALANSKKGIPMASDLIKHVTDATFEADVLQAAQPILVDYWAEWCGPCKMIAPILDDLSTTYEGKLQIAKMNVDENRDIPAKFGIRGIPTLMLFKNGQLAATKVGAMSKAQMVAFIDQQLEA
jgi:thioredoxin 1